MSQAIQKTNIDYIGWRSIVVVLLL